MPRGQFTVPKWSNKTGSRARSIDLECESCGKAITRYESTIKAHNFCGFECYGVWCSANRKGEDSPTYRGGRVNYRGPSWKDARKEALDRDRHTCQRCGATDRLQVHHLMPYRCFDSHLEANKLDNLQTLCMPCHRAVDGYLRLTKVAPPPSYVRTVTCVECAEDFASNSGMAKRCPTCRPRRVRKRVSAD